MNKLLALADRVEKLTGPDREVDAEIYETTSEAIDYQRVAIKLSDASRLEPWHDGWVTVSGAKGEADPYPEDLPRYTSSLDAAKTLVPKGWNWMAGNRDQPLARAYVNNGEMAFVGAGMKRNLSRQWFETTAAEPALALTACALRARAHGGGEE